MSEYKGEMSNKSLKLRVFRVKGVTCFNDFLKKEMLLFHWSENVLEYPAKVHEHLQYQPRIPSRLGLHTVDDYTRHL